MTRSQRQWAWGLLGVGAGVVLIIAVLIVASGDDPVDIPDEKGPRDARVAWGEPDGDPTGVVMILLES